MRRDPLAVDRDAYIPQPVTFQRVDEYTAFMAEWRWVKSGELQVHFFRSPEHAVPEREWWPGAPTGTRERMRAKRLNEQHYWSERFPEVLNLVAPEVLGRRHPELWAQYVEEVDSWQLGCTGLSLWNPDQVVAKLFEELDKMADPPEAAPAAKSDED